MAHLIVVDPDGGRREVPLTSLPLRMGRQADNEVVLRDTRVSRLQAQIAAGSDDSHILEDLGSRHGTFVNGQKITQHTLCAGDEIGFGVPNSYRVIYAADGPTITEIVERIESRAPEQAGPRELYHLGVLLDVARSLGSGLSLQDVLATVLDAAIQVTGTERGVLLLAGPGGALEPSVARSAKKQNLPLEELQVSMSVVNRVALTRRELIVTDAGDEIASRSSGQINPQHSMARLALRTVVAIPIDKIPVIEMLDVTIAARQAELLGVLYLDSHSPSAAFSNLDRDVIRTLAREAAAVIENARLFSAARAKERLDHEIQIASEIQQKLLPKSLPNSPAIAVAGFTLACYSVGGDCFDVIELGEGRFGFFVGDVAGKGISAALLATLLQGVFFTTASLDMPLSGIFGRVNRYLSDRSAIERYATVFYGVLQKDGRFEYVNAGHVPPLLRRKASQIEALKSGSVPVGLFGEAEFQTASVTLEPGDFLVMYSDGVSEAANIKGEFFEEEGLRRVLSEFKGQTVEELSVAVREAIRAFTQGAPQSDDITALILHHKGGAA